MTSAPILPFRLRRRTYQHAWTGAHTSTLEEKHGLVRLEDDRIIIQTTCSVKTTNHSAMGSIDTTYENFPVEERSVNFSDLDGVTLRVPTWNFWSAPRVVFHVREMKIVEGLPSAGPAEFSVPVAYRDRVLANAFVVQCHQALSTVKSRLLSGATPALES